MFGARACPSRACVCGGRLPAGAALLLCPLRGGRACSLPRVSPLVQPALGDERTCASLGCMWSSGLGCGGLEAQGLSLGDVYPCLSSGHGCRPQPRFWLPSRLWGPSRAGFPLAWEEGALLPGDRGEDAPLGLTPGGNRGSSSWTRPGVAPAPGAQACSAHPLGGFEWTGRLVLGAVGWNHTLSRSLRRVSSQP